MQKSFTMQVFFKLFLHCIALHFVKERAASAFRRLQLTLQTYNKNLKYASVFKFFFATTLRLCCIVLHCAALRCAACVAITTALRCIVQTQLQTCICLQHCIAGCNFSSYC